MAGQVVWCSAAASGTGTAGTIGDLPGSDNVAAALRLVGQVVWCPAAASECRLSLPAGSK